MSNSNDVDFAIGFGSGMAAFLGALFIFGFGYTVGISQGKSDGEAKASIVAIKAANKVKANPNADPFTTIKEVESLSYQAQEILRLY